MATKRAGASSSKQSASAKKSAPAKKAAAKSSAPSKKAAKKAAPAKGVAPEKKSAPAKKAAAKKAPAKKASSGASPFDKKFLDAQRELLLEERATLSAQAESLRAEADALARDREPGDVQFDDESGEGDTLAVERDFDLARAAAAQQTIEEIDAALGRIDAGTYGVCEYSGQSIPKERLRAIPWARERVEFKTRSFR